MNEHEHVKLPRNLAFHLIQIFLSLAIGFGVLWIRNDIRKELSNYVTHSEFSTYQIDHAKWGEEVMRRWQGTIEENTRRLDRIEMKLDRLSEKPK